MRRGARGNYAADAASLPAHEQETKSLLLLDRRAAAGMLRVELKLLKPQERTSPASEET